jgi:glutathione reductase (NADPH)
LPTLASRIPRAQFDHNAAEVINFFALAMKFGLTTYDLKKVLWAYPTHIFDVKSMLGA